MDISCREASKGHVRGGAPDSIALQSAVKVVNRTNEKDVPNSNYSITNAFIRMRAS